MTSVSPDLILKGGIAVVDDCIWYAVGVWEIASPKITGMIVTVHRFHVRSVRSDWLTRGREGKWSQQGKGSVGGMTDGCSVACPAGVE